MYKYDANIKHCFNKTIDLPYYFKALLYFRMILNNKSMETTVKERLMKMAILLERISLLWIN